jgi:hypothetical protein
MAGRDSHFQELSLNTPTAAQKALEMREEFGER